MEKTNFTYLKYLKQLTRQLIRLLTEDVTVRLVAALRDKPQTRPQLEDATGAAQKTVAQCLDLLEAHGIVKWQSAGRGSTGRPTPMWSLAATDELIAFERGCDEFKLALLRRQVDEYDADGSGS